MSVNDPNLETKPWLLEHFSLVWGSGFWGETL